MNERYLNRSEAADYLTQQGLTVARGTLQKLVSVGGGPTYHKFGRRAVYRQEDLIAWAQARMSAPRRSTSGA